MNGRRSKAKQEIDWNDPFDPRTWEEPPQTCLIYLDDRAHKTTLVDYETYLFLVQAGIKCRLHVDGRGKEHVSFTINHEYLHRFVMKLYGIEKPSPRHFLVDHMDGDGLNNTRSNLRWATPEQNSMNVRGYYWKQLSLFGRDYGD